MIYFNALQGMEKISEENLQVVLKNGNVVSRCFADTVFTDISRLYQNDKKAATYLALACSDKQDNKVTIIPTTHYNTIRTFGLNTRLKAFTDVINSSVILNDDRTDIVTI